MKTVKLREFKDQRGNLVENTLEKIMNDSKHFFISKSNPQVIRGNHYHKNKSEWFYIIQGSAKIAVVDIETKEREELIIRAEENLIVHMEPNKAHAIQNIGTSEMILLALINEVLDHENPDTYPFEVIEKKT